MHPSIIYVVRKR